MRFGIIKILKIVKKGHKIEKNNSPSNIKDKWAKISKGGKRIRILWYKKIWDGQRKEKWVESIKRGKRTRVRNRSKAKKGKKYIILPKVRKGRKKAKVE